MPFYAGFDSGDYPGDASMRSLLADTNLVWCGFYLYPSDTWLPHYAAIKQMGWGVAPIYIGKQPSSAKLQAIISNHLGHKDALNAALYANGKIDGDEAVARAVQATIPPPCVIYFDVEEFTTLPAWLEYYRGWCRAVINHGYSVGLYAPTGQAKWVIDQLMAMRSFDIALPYVWSGTQSKVNPDPKVVPEADFLSTPLPTPDPATPLASATSWQHIGNYGIKWNDTTTTPGKTTHRRFAPIDFDSSVYRDPGLGFLSGV